MDRTQGLTALIIFAAIFAIIVWPMVSDWVHEQMHPPRVISESDKSLVVEEADLGLDPDAPWPPPEPIAVVAPRPQRSKDTAKRHKPSVDNAR
jgi:hypothetical protein